jgi:DNA topoisomerase IB
MAETIARRRLRRSDCSGPGLRRLRRGRGFTYLDERGQRIADPKVVERVQALAIPPAWQEVWICPDPWGHLQATGVDAAGRKQYLYHARWRERRDREKFERMVRFGKLLPRLRRRLGQDLAVGEPTREAVLACAVRLLDVGLFRVGSEQYADEDHGVGLATVRKDHVTLQGEQLVFDYPAKGGIRRVQAIEDPLSGELVRTLRRRRGGPRELLAYRDGRRWSGLRSDDINEYLKRHLGEEFSAKDFRTWNATVVASVSLGADAPNATTKAARRRAVNRAVRGVSEMIGNTPAVARRSYIDPRVFDRYLAGWTIAGALKNLDQLDHTDDRDRARLERAVLELIDDDTTSSALHRAPVARAA